MSDNTESGQLSGGQEAPTSDPSQAGDEHTYVSKAEFEAVQQGLNRLEKMVSSFQSGKDKGVDRIEKQVGELNAELDRFAELVEGGMKPADAKRQMAIDDMLADYRNRQRAEVGGGDTGGTGDHQPDLDEQAILSQLGLDPNDEDAVKILGETQDKTERIAKWAELAVQQKAQQARQPTKGQMMPVGGGQTPPDELSEQTEKLEAILKNPSNFTAKEVNEASKELERLIKS
jgi:hypothetical protein